MIIFGEIDRFLRVVGLQDNNLSHNKSFDVTNLVIICAVFMCTSLQMVWYFIIDAEAFNDRAESFVSFINIFSMSTIFAIIIWQRDRFITFLNHLRAKIYERIVWHLIKNL